ncbi:NepR family anti-sigma factor [Novosphingobium sp. BL-8H]|uniref:NepR family anti-sigma factor n=1 Tax=Novosphingobium sp. BL-8H TaxID=3127640 RepID=UPI00375781F4
MAGNFYPGRRESGLDRMAALHASAQFEREFALNQPPDQGEPDKPGMPPETNAGAHRVVGLDAGIEGNVRGIAGQAGTGQGAPGPGEPGWAKGLRKLYNSVVDEPLPDSFRDLLKKLDGSDDD